MPLADWTWDPKAEGAGWGAQPGDKGVAREAQTQEEGIFNILLSSLSTHRFSPQSCQSVLITNFLYECHNSDLYPFFFHIHVIKSSKWLSQLFVSAAPCRPWRRSSRGSSRSRRSSSRWAVNPNALTPPPRVEYPNFTPSQTCTTPVYSLKSNLAALTDSSWCECASFLWPLLINMKTSSLLWFHLLVSMTCLHTVPSLNQFFSQLIGKCPMDNMHFFEHVQNWKVCSR